jgi:hypothetical protein
MIFENRFCLLAGGRRATGARPAQRRSRQRGSWARPTGQILNLKKKLKLFLNAFLFENCQMMI